RVNGRRAFPERGGNQPKAGETWKVVLTGENRPRNTVYFVQCVEMVYAAEAQRSGNGAIVYTASAPAAAPAAKLSSYDRARKLVAPVPAVFSSLAALGTLVARNLVSNDGTLAQLASSLSGLCQCVDENLVQRQGIVEQLKAFHREELELARK